MCKVFVNGNWIGCHRNANDLVRNIKDMRRSYTIPREISIVRDIYTKEVKFFTDAGRVQRPAFIVENSRLRIKKMTIPNLISGRMNFENLL